MDHGLREGRSHLYLSRRFADGHGIQRKQNRPTLEREITPDQRLRGEASARIVSRGLAACDIRLYPQEKHICCDVEGSFVGSSPGTISGGLAGEDAAEVFALGAEDEDSSRAGGPEVAFCIDLQTITSSFALGGFERLGVE